MFQEVNTAQMDASELYEIYISEAVPSSVKKKYKIGHIFGTQRKSAVYFGKEQPALLVYQNGGEESTDVSPHTVKGRRVSIEDYLSEKMAELEEDS